MGNAGYGLFEGIAAEERRCMIDCFQGREQAFPAGAVIADYQEESHEIGVLISGRAEVIRIDSDGERTILEHLVEGEPFGRQLSISGSTGDAVTVATEGGCRVLFLDYRKIMGRCDNACPFHVKMEQNLIRIVMHKVRRLSERVEVLSRRTIREKLLCYFAMQPVEADGSFQLPFSLSRLADYISADRSAMMRELKKLKEEEILAIERRHVVMKKAAR